MNRTFGIPTLSAAEERYEVRNSLPGIAGVRMVILYIIGFYILLIIIGWIIKKIGKFLETRRYRAKLEKLTPQLEAIDTKELATNVLAIRESYSSLMKLLESNYKVSNEEEQVKSIYQYVQEEANYRRSKRKPPKRSHGRKYRRYRRYY